MKTIDEMIAVMQAAKLENGKNIQISDKSVERWSDCYGMPGWNWGEFDYRIVPPPPQ